MRAHATAIFPTDDALATDLGRTAVAFGVGALDAYRCDAFVDSLARCLRSCRLNSHAPPTGYGELELPIGPLMTDYAARNDWGLRMAAGALMERDNLLQFGRLKDLPNSSLPPGPKLWQDLVDDFVALDRRRRAGFRRAEYAALTGGARADGRKRVSAAALSRMGEIVQRRHDVVHDCDRPKTAKQPLTPAQAGKVLTDVRDFATILDDHLQAHRIY